MWKSDEVKEKASGRALNLMVNQFLFFTARLLNVTICAIIKMFPILYNLIFLQRDECKIIICYNKY
ncbi:hypothetical protein NEOC95_000596 [Neochlamydia sp. AcF95]|nr:hypothetical protein [Neochlamydia sp. AcF95]